MLRQPRSARATAAFFGRLDDLPAIVEVEQEPELRSATGALSSALAAAGSMAGMVASVSRFVVRSRWAVSSFRLQG